MADYEVKLRVDAETADAQQQLADVEAKGRRVKRSLEGGGGNGGGGNGGPRAQGRVMGEEMGRVAGRAIGKAIAGFVAHQVSGIVFEGLRTHGGDNTNINRAEATVGGVFQGGTMGWMVGGPWGAAIGAVVGGIGSLIGELQKEDKQRYAVNEAIRTGERAQNEGFGDRVGRTALNGLLDRAWTANGGRGEILREQALAALTRYDSARTDLRNAAGKDKTSTDYKDILEAFQHAQQQRFESLGAYADERINRLGNASPYEASEFGDSMSARGMYVGPQVDVADVNETLGDRVQQQVDLLRQLVEISRNGTADTEKFNELIRKVDKLSL